MFTEKDFWIGFAAGFAAMYVWRMVGPRLKGGAA